jgi:hypothetical protein
MDLTVQMYRIVKDEKDGIGATNGQSVIGRLIEKLPGKPARADVEAGLELLGTAGLLGLERQRGDTVVFARLAAPLPTAEELVPMSRAARLACLRLALFLAHDPSLAQAELPIVDLEGAITKAFPGIEDLKNGQFLKTVVVNVEASRPYVQAPLPAALRFTDPVWFVPEAEGQKLCEAHHQADAAGADCHEAHGSLSGWWTTSFGEFVRIFGSVEDAVPLLENGAVYCLQPQGV